jgi:hypothetical protein
MKSSTTCRRSALVDHSSPRYSICGAGGVWPGSASAAAGSDAAMLTTHCQTQVHTMTAAHKETPGAPLVRAHLGLWAPLIRVP